jgi:hypothetical protein
MVYKSRREKSKKGGAIPEIHDVHTSAQHPEKLLHAIQAQPEIADIAHTMLRQHVNVAKAIKHAPRFPRFAARIPDKSIDVHSLARSIFKKHKLIHMPTLGGGVSDIINVANKIGNPIEEAKAAKGSYDGVDFGDRSARGMLRSGISAYAGNFHTASTHLKTAALIPGAQIIEPAAQGFSAVGFGLDKLRSII